MFGGGGGGTPLAVPGPKLGRVGRDVMARRNQGGGGDSAAVNSAASALVRVRVRVGVGVVGVVARRTAT